MANTESNNPLELPKISWKSRWVGQSAEGFIWPLFLFVTFYLGAERWLHSDSAYTLYRILNHQNLFYDRFTCELLVWPGQILALLGAPASWVMQSINLILPLMAWAGWAFFAKNSLRWLYFLLFFIGGQELFFIGYSEIGLSAWAFITAVLLITSAQKNVGVKTNSSNNRVASILTYLSLLVMLISHPAAWLFTPAVALFAGSSLPRKPTLLLILGLCAMFCFKFLLFPANSYDTGLYANLINAQTLEHITGLHSLRFLGGASWTFIPGVTLIACLTMGLAKPWRLMNSLYFLGVLGTIFFSILIYSLGDSQINMEKFFFPSALLSMSALAFYQFNGSLQFASHSANSQYNGIEHRKTKLEQLPNQIIGILPWFLALGSLLGIQKHSPTYTQRKNEVFNLVIKMPHTKMAAHQDSLYARIQPGSLWGLSYETAIASQLLNLDDTRTMKALTAEELSDWENIEHRIGDSLILGAPFEMPQNSKSLNAKYFHFPKGAVYQLEK